MKFQLLKFILLLPVIAIYACSNYPETPEEVIRQFIKNKSEGDCDAAQALCEGNAKSSTQGSIDAGCKPYKSVIDSVKCKIEGIEARCYCYEKLEGMEFHFPYMLEKIDGQWKITDYSKDLFSEEPLIFD